MIEADRLFLRAGGRWILEGGSFRAAPGQVLLVTGENGTGKSVLARAVAGIAPVVAGRVTVGGLEVRKRKARRRIGYLPQGGGVTSYLTVSENLAFASALAGVPRSQRSRLCVDLLELTGLASLRHAEASRLTPGQRQRLSLGLTLAGEPMALVLDDPLGALDDSARRDLCHLLQEMAGMGKAILITAGAVDGLPADVRLVLSSGCLKGGEVA